MVDTSTATIRSTTLSRLAQASVKRDMASTEQGMEFRKQQIEYLNQEVAKVNAKIDSAWAAYEDATEGEVKVTRLQKWQKLVAEKENLQEERKQVYASPSGSGSGTVAPKLKTNTLGAAIEHLYSLQHFAQPMVHKTMQEREEAFNLNRDDIGTEILNKVLQAWETAGSVDRKEGSLLTLETGTGVGKTYAANNVDVLLWRAARAEEARARSKGQPPSEALQGVLAAFEEGRVCVLNSDFSKGDNITREDANPRVALGIRLAARGIFNVHTEVLRDELERLSDRVDSLFTERKVWPHLCQRLRTAHGLGDYHADSRRLVLVCAFDEFQRMSRNMEGDFGYTKKEARSFCKDFQRCLAYLVLTEGGERSPAATHGVCFVPMLVGTCLSHLEEFDLSMLRWERRYLQPLSFEDSREVFRKAALQGLRWTGSRARKEAFLHRLSETHYVEAVLKLAGGIPALITQAARTLAEELELCSWVEGTMSDDNWSGPRLCSFTLVWMQKVQTACSFRTCACKAAASSLVPIQMKNALVSHGAPLTQWR